MQAYKTFLWIERSWDVLALAAIAWAAVLLVAAGVPGPVRAGPSLVTMLFAPGYGLLCAAFPRSDDLDLAERLALSLGISVVLTALAALAIALGPIDLSGMTTAVTLSLLVSALGAVVVGRRAARNTDPDHLHTAPPLKQLRRHWAGHFTPTHLAMVLVLLCAAAGALYLVRFQELKGSGEPFTEFSMMGSNGDPITYQTELVVGVPTPYMVRIRNREQRLVTYKLEVLLGSRLEQVLTPITLDHGQGWSNTIFLSPSAAGERDKLQFRLFRENDAQPYLTSYVWVKVDEKRLG